MPRVLRSAEARHEDIVARWQRHFEEIRYYC